MDVETGIKSRLPNRHVAEGQERAPRRSYLYAAGLTGRQVHQPLGPIEIVAVAGTLDVNLTGAERAERKTNWQHRETNHTSGVFGKYTRQIGPTVSGALTYLGGVYEKLRYVDV